MKRLAVCAAILIFCLAFAAASMAQADAMAKKPPMLISKHDRELLYKAEGMIRRGELKEDAFQKDIAVARIHLAMEKKFWGPSVLPTPPYLEKIFRRLLAELPEHDPRIHFRLIYVAKSTPAASAWAYLDGTIVFSKEIVDSADNEADIAAVLGHEIGHVIEGHEREYYPIFKYLVEHEVSQGVTKYLVEYAGMDDLDTLVNRHQFRADDFSIRLLIFAGYDTCALSAIWRATKTDARYMTKSDELLRDIPCVGSKYIIATREEFFSFKEEQLKVVFTIMGPH